MSRVKGTTGNETEARKQKKVNILLVGTEDSNTDEIKRQLSLISRFECTAWHCSDPEEAFDFLSLKDFKIDLVFLDLSLFHANYPKEYFLHIKASIPTIPIIVLTEKTDYDLIVFVMTEGAADNTSYWQLRTDPDRIGNIVESCCAREHIAKRERSINAKALQDAHDWQDNILRKSKSDSLSNMQELSEENAELRKKNATGKAALQEAGEQSETDLQHERDTSAYNLSHAAEKAASRIKHMEDEISRLSKEKERAELDLQDALERGSANLKNEHQRFIDDIKDIRDKSYAEIEEARISNETAIDKLKEDQEEKLQSSKSEITKLRKDKEQSRSDLNAAQKKGADDLDSAHKKFDKSAHQTQNENDAILKYAQDKAALDLKKVQETNKELREYNEFAREMISGAYSSAPIKDKDKKTKEEREE